MKLGELINKPATPGIFFELCSNKAVKLEFLAHCNEPVSVSSGFIIRQRDGFYLYSCWHSVTGIDFFGPKVVQPPKPRRVRIQMKKCTSLRPGVTHIGGVHFLTEELYGVDNKPRWIQDDMHRENLDLESLGIFIPRIDIVALKIDAADNIEPLTCFEETDIYTSGLVVGASVFIVGLPHGYSTLGEEPHPISLRRSIAATRANNAPVLVDGIGARGMSGSPVFCQSGPGMKLYGVYCGALHTSDKAKAWEEKGDVFAALGVITPMLRASFLY
jgi:hypothetical protein